MSIAIIIFFLHLLNSLSCFLKVEGGGTANDMADTMMQKFWDSALAFEPPDEEYDTHAGLSPQPLFMLSNADEHVFSSNFYLIMHSELSGLVPSEYTDTAKSIYPPLLGNSFSFKFEDQKGRVHRFNCG